MANIKCLNIRKSYGGLTVIDGLNLDIADHEFVVFLGPSGCGKSTMLRMIAGLEEISGGTVSIGDQNVTNLPPGERGVAMVFQSYALYPHMSVFENIAFGLRRQKVPAADISRRVAHVSSLLGLDQFLERKPKNLSGGQQQRVAMARAMIKTPKLFLFDEPLSNLDAKLRERLRTEIRRMHLELKTTTIFVTHDQLEAMTIADRIVLMRAGVIEQQGTPSEIFDRPATRFVADFIGSPAMNFRDCQVRLDGQEAELSSGSIKLRVPVADYQGFADGGAVEVGLRPSKMDIASPGDANVITGTVVLVENMGSDGQVIVDVDGRDMSFVTKAFRTLEPGQKVDFSIEPASIHIFSKDTGRSLLRAAA
ncbi:sn-glycerol-3-phosphate ABC transporter ATP-binding protein UgpC [Agrobacterium sp. a22-2]|uniref:ABC transporter ATP-binding protein n=1 Tax=Agrobacterium sp. a22-2 TaxID=2283840 RepID=UPI001445DF0D|nr:sn-glycerol-3-phosphate ABC transporter ATP-binding protein UgpC [Agrobacterium sp. a22-2]NKN38162.1 sn-glycerol-3-phosphate ABC transporter ATP-binding protein UgpC [Agrobacterium sp. a22-2]